jgi:hypothetical protein
MFRYFHFDTIKCTDDIVACLKEDIGDEQARNIEHELMLKHTQNWLNNNQKTNSKSLAETIVHARTGVTSLHVVCAKGYRDVIDILIRAGANINSVDNDGWTPLHAAAHWDKHDVIKIKMMINVTNTNVSVRYYNKTFQSTSQRLSQRD